MIVWFDRLFPVVMVTFPALIVWNVKSHPSAATEDAPARARGVYLFTAAALLVHAVALVLFETLQEERTALRSSWTTLFSLFGFFVLWFRFAAPALAARHPGWGQVQRETPVRSASLAPRHTDTTSMLPTVALALGWALYAVCIGAVAWGIAEGAHPTLVAGLIMWPGFLWGVRSVRTEAEPRDACGSPQLARAYADLRRFRAWCFFWCGALGTASIGTIAAAGSLDPAHIGLIGAIGGSLVGLMGATMGTMASIRRARINGLLHELNHQGTEGTA